jgi:hypothetical protein
LSCSVYLCLAYQVFVNKIYTCFHPLYLSKHIEQIHIHTWLSDSL